MLRTIVRRARVHQPMIKFPERHNGSSSSEPHTPHPHPAAPKEVAKSFDHFQEVFKSGPHFDPSKVEQSSPSQGKSGGGGDGGKTKGGLMASDNPEAVDDVTQLPARFWKTPALEWEEKEMEAVMSGGATLVQK
ncbi:hypothetical protein FA10DRAFT_268529 [Acaromyces ingoldii]|uniref:Uncharacterized protein n=1 Tax=Acaromyces ingoldii TaxID=215250 RepID=A0A316YGH9_9BASI|nr:hypothetical protein FA10DRAFT_268529 [Acaromyces ingoldii]PWN88329.1 hypothetical protein FA10DRAFT_268529 [Acaromyces ingoldii]